MPPKKKKKSQMSRRKQAGGSKLLVIRTRILPSYSSTINQNSTFVNILERRKVFGRYVFKVYL